VDIQADDALIEGTIEGEPCRFFLADHPHLSIGRAPQGTVVLADDPMVSRKHALIQREGSGEYYLSDLGSRNGTTLNGVPVTAPVPLEDGDSFVVGSHAFVFRRKAFLTRSEREPPSQEATDLLVVRRMITTMVVDVRDYTGLARKMGEAGVSKVMNEFFRRSGELLKRNGSWAQKYGGDSVMSVWTHQEEHEREDGGTVSAELVPVLRSLVGIFRVAEKLEGRASLPQPLTLGAGVNSGQAVIGNMGSVGAADFTAMGDAVNKAFRLEATSKQVGQPVVFGRGTVELLGADPGIRSIFTAHTVTLKGYDRAEEVYGLELGGVEELVGRLSPPPPPTGAF
jgi:adenylate cyclase